MSYTLDGIPTAMRVVVTGLGAAKVETFVCPCGWKQANTADETPYRALDNLAAHRFHYTFCPQAKVRGESTLWELLRENLTWLSKNEENEADREHTRVALMYMNNLEFEFLRGEPGEGK